MKIRLKIKHQTALGWNRYTNKRKSCKGDSIQSNGQLTYANKYLFPFTPRPILYQLQLWKLHEHNNYSKSVINIYKRTQQV